MSHQTDKGIFAITRMLFGTAQASLQFQNVQEGSTVASFLNKNKRKSCLLWGGGVRSCSVFYQTTVSVRVNLYQDH